WRAAELACFALEEARVGRTRVARWFGQEPRARVLRLRLESGDEIKATADHPFWTPAGMVPLGRLGAGGRAGGAPFRGVPYEAPSDDVILTEQDLARKWAAVGKGPGGGGLQQTLAFLLSRDLLPLRYSSPALPYLCKLLGHVYGDGSLHFDSGGKG